MTQGNLNSSVGARVATHPQTSRVFESLQIDYCCGGGMSLEQACWDRGLDVHQVVQQLERAVTDEEEKATRNWLDASLTELCDHIERTHHAYLKEELPMVQELFASLRSELEPHMLKEDRVLFPAIRRLEESHGNPSFPFGTVANLIRVIEQEHDNAGYAFSRHHAITRDYQIPANACNTYRAMLAGLPCLEHDMHRHVHKENSILFPRAIDLERARLAKKACGFRADVQNSRSEGRHETNDR